MTTTTIDARPSAFTLDDLAARWIEAKRDENDANARRLAVEQAIISLTGVKESGAETHTTEAGMKITVAGKLLFKVDLDSLQTLCAKLPPELRPLKTETVADEKGLR